MYDKKSITTNAQSLPRRTIRGASKKRMKSGTFVTRSTPGQPQVIPSRADDDSGLGGDSTLDGEGAGNHTTTLTSTLTPQAKGGVTRGVGGPYSAFDVKDQVFVESGLVSAKRPRLDMTEEANELPGEEPPQRRSETNPKIVSFKNVPELILPVPAVQIQPNALITHSLHQRTPQPQQHVLTAKQMLRTTPAKADKPPKRRTKCHILEGNLPSVSSDGLVELELLTQPEGQHRARYQTEGSRGAVKDRAGTGHPCVRLKGYNKSTILQVFVASDGGCVSPHLFYQACKVSGKNSTPCKEEKIHGTTVLEIGMLPERDMTVSCDCVGILKERNVDVEQRLKSFVSRSKKKSTKCRLVFRTSVVLPSGAQEHLQLVSQPISCTQPPGVPEICRKSRSKCSVEGKEELFIIGKNFNKDTQVLFREVEVFSQEERVLWSHSVSPEKDYLQSTHLICQVPPYHDTRVKCEVVVQLFVTSCGKMSDPHSFSYTPLAPAKEIQHQSTPPYSLPKGVSPNAVKLNQLYEKSGGGLPLDSKEVFLLSDSSVPTTTNTFIKTTDPWDRDRTSANPVHMGRLLATVNPQVQTTPTFITQPPQRINSNTLTTATVLTPKPTPTSNSPMASGPLGCNTTPEEPKCTPRGQGKEKNMLESLVQMLKLLTTLPGALQTPIVDLVADEIMKQVKKEKTSALNDTCKTIPNAMASLSTLTDLLNQKNKPPQPHQFPQQKTEDMKESIGQQQSAIIHRPQQVTPMVKLYPMMKPTSDVFTLHTSNQGMFLGTRVTESLHQHSPHGGQIPLSTTQESAAGLSNPKVVYPVSTLLGKEYMSDVHKTEYSPKEVNFVTTASKTDFTNHRLGSPVLGVSMVPTLCHTTSPVAVNVTTEASATAFHLSKAGEVGPTTYGTTYSQFTPTNNNDNANCITKVEFMTSGSATEAVSNIVSASNTLLPVQNIPSTVGLTHTEEIASTTENTDTLGTLTERQGTRTIKNDFLPSVKTHAIKKEVVLPLTNSTPPYRMEDLTPRQGVTIDSSLALQMEDCDPLLSQANAVQAPMPLRTVQGEGVIATDHSTMIHCPSSGSVSSEMSLAQLSENDLLNYINPTCFDHV